MVFIRPPGLVKLPFSLSLSIQSKPGGNDASPRELKKSQENPVEPRSPNEKSREAERHCNPYPQPSPLT